MKKIDLNRLFKVDGNIVKPLDVVDTLPKETLVKILVNILDYLSPEEGETEPKEEDWEKEFDEKFVNYLQSYKDLMDINTLGVPMVPKDIKSFIRSLISKTKEEEKERIKKIMEKMKKDISSWHPAYEGKMTQESVKRHNQLLSYLLEEIG